MFQGVDVFCIRFTLIIVCTLTITCQRKRSWVPVPPQLWLACRGESRSGSRAARVRRAVARRVVTDNRLRANFLGSFLCARSFF